MGRAALSVRPNGATGVYSISGRDPRHGLRCRLASASDGWYPPGALLFVCDLDALLSSGVCRRHTTRPPPAWRPQNHVFRYVSPVGAHAELASSAPELHSPAAPTCSAEDCKPSTHQFAAERSKLHPEEEYRHLITWPGKVRNKLEFALGNCVGKHPCAAFTLYARWHTGQARLARPASARWPGRRSAGFVEVVGLPPDRREPAYWSDRRRFRGYA
jgi:hypothetical protein